MGGVGVKKLSRNSAKILEGKNTRQYIFKNGILLIFTTGGGGGDLTVFNYVK